MQIVEIDIKNFRGIKSFRQSFYGKKLICLIGRGDSGKSTILEAISYALYPSWNLQLNDNDFFNGDPSNSISIDISIKVPDEFILEEKYGLYLRGYNKDEDKIYDEIKDEHEKILTIRFEMAKDLEPKWYVYNMCQAETFKEINQRDRAKLNCFIVSDYIDKHFTWGVGTPLCSISKGNTSADEHQKKFVEPIRDAISKINEGNFSDLDKCFKEGIISPLISTENTKTFMELKDISYNINKLSLHDENDIPYRLKGKGSKRLLSIAIQLATAQDGAITLIDEIEQGLEPDRVKKLVAELKKKSLETDSQIFITTHSDNVITELGAENLYIIRKDNDKSEALSVSKDLTELVRSCPEAFFSNKIIVCEGKTELGICRSIDNYLQFMSKPAMSYQGCVCTLGGGSSFAQKAALFKQLGFDTHIFCDSDVCCSPAKTELLAQGVAISDCEDGNCIEKQVFKDLPPGAIMELVNYAIADTYKTEKNSFLESIRSTYPEFPDDWKDECAEYIRTALGDKANKKEWFKRIDHGEFLGDVIFKYWDNISSTSCLKNQIEQIIKWVEE